MHKPTNNFWSEACDWLVFVICKRKLFCCFFSLFAFLLFSGFLDNKRKIVFELCIKIFTTEYLFEEKNIRFFPLRHISASNEEIDSRVWVGVLIFVFLIGRYTLTRKKPQDSPETKAETPKKEPKPKDPPKNSQREERALQVAKSSVRRSPQSHPPPRTNRKKVFLVPMKNGSSVLMQIRPEGTIGMLSAHQTDSGQFTTQHIIGHHITAERVSSHSLISRRIPSQSSGRASAPPPTPPSLPSLETKQNSKEPQIHEID